MTTTGKVGRRTESSGATWPTGLPPLGVAAAAAVLLTGSLFGGAAPATAQEGRVPEVARPVPAPVVPPPFVRAAVAQGTRTEAGEPGPRYWRNRADYVIETSLDPETARLSGRETVRYTNESPDSLPGILLHLYQNLHAPGVVRNGPEELTGGVELVAVRVGGREARPVGPGVAAPAYVVQGTVMGLTLERPVPPGGVVELALEWEVTLPASGAGRMGHSDHEVYFVGYWFPKVAVYDDLRGWDGEPYLGSAEFYDEYGDYDVSITVPQGWTVMATGELRNPTEVYAPRTAARLEVAASADTVVHVATSGDLEAGMVTATAASGRLTWHFTAEEVRDFAWTTSDVQRWDATSAVVPDRDGDGARDRVLIHSFWREDRAPLWAEQALYGKHSIEHHSRYTGFAYPWPHMTSVEGGDIIGGGMEYPMLTLIGPYQGREASDLYNVTAHELAHMWIPMIVGTNETRHAWMDEGSTTFLEDQARAEHEPGSDADAQEMENYLDVARADAEESMMRDGDYYPPGPSYSTASYAKPATLLVTLRALLGEERFLEAYRGFIADWAYRHPTPWDFFNAFEVAAGRDLDWFWTPFYYETWVLDQAVANVTTRDGAPVITVEDRGWAPMPVRLRIATTDGGVVEREIPVDVWLEGRTTAEVELPASVGEVTRVEIDAEHVFPDADRSDNVWPAGG